MNGAKLTDLFAWEWTRTGRSPLMWTVLAVLAAAFVWGAQSGASLHRSQGEAQQRAMAEQTAWYDSVKQRARAYAARGAEVPYWQDPTNVAGFSRYFLFAQSFKPHLASSVLAVGVSDLAPSRQRVRLETPFGVEPSYDFEHPRGLAIGRFDLAFAVVYLLPIGLVLIFGLLGTYERDLGVLRLVAAQPVSPRTWLGSRVLAILAWVLPAIILALIVAVALTGAPIANMVPELFGASALICAYTLFWAALAFLILSFWASASATLGALTAVWVALCIGVPLAAQSVLGLFAPARPGVFEVDALRRVNDQLNAERDDIITATFLARPDLRDHLDMVEKIDYSTRWTFLAPELERRLLADRERTRRSRDATDSASRIAAVIAPPLAVQTGLGVLAGTDAARHRSFEQQTRAYQLELRQIIYGKVQREISHPTPRPAGTQGRLNLTEFDFLPAFQLREMTWANRVSTGLHFALWPLLFAAGLALIAVRRLRRWPTGL